MFCRRETRSSLRPGYIHCVSWFFQRKNNRQSNNHASLRKYTLQEDSSMKTDRHFKPYSELTIRDNYMFTEVFRDTKLLTGLLRRVIPEEDIGSQDIAIKEMTVSPVYQKRGVRFDVYSTDGRHLFDVEMQVEDRGEVFPRAVMNLSSMIIHSRDPSEPFRPKGKAYVIFFCAYDETETGNLLEHYRYMSRSTHKEKDLTNIIIVNCPVKAEDHPSIRPFADYVMDGTNTTEDTFIQEVESAVQLKKKDSEGEERYMSYEYELYCAKKDGLKEGEAIGMIRMYDAFREMSMNEEEAVSKTAEAYQKTAADVMHVIAERDSLLEKQRI